MSNIYFLKQFTIIFTTICSGTFVVYLLIGNVKRNSLNDELYDRVLLARETKDKMQESYNLKQSHSESSKAAQAKASQEIKI